MKPLRWIAALIAALALPAQAELRDIRYDYQRAERAQTDFTAADAGVQRVVLAQLMLAQFTSTNPSVTGVFNPASPGPIGATTPDAITGTTITATTKFLAPAGTAAAPSYSFSASPTYGFYQNTGVSVDLSIGNSRQFAWQANTMYVLSDTAIIAMGASQDVQLARDAANTLAQRNGTNAQKFSVYNTFTDASNYERLGIAWASNVVTLKAENAGTGTQRRIDIVGTIAADNAATGAVGEYVSATAAANAVALTTNTTATVTSASLTAGDWDCTGVVNYTFAASTSFTNLVGGTSTTAATLGTQDTTFDFETPAAVPTATKVMSWVVPMNRFSISATTTVYLVTQATFTVSTLGAGGTLRCRRMR